MDREQLEFVQDTLLPWLLLGLLVAVLVNFALDLPDEGEGFPIPPWLIVVVALATLGLLWWSNQELNRQRAEERELIEAYERERGQTSAMRSTLTSPGVQSVVAFTELGLGALQVGLGA